MKLCLLVLATLSLLVAPARADSYSFKEPFSRSAPFNATGRISLENVNGSITIETWDKNEIQIEGEKSAKTAEELKLIDLNIVLSVTRADIRVRLPKRLGGWLGNNSVRGAVKFKLMIPARASLDSINTVNSSITIVGVQGTTNVETVNGRVDARGLGGPTTLKAVNGGLAAHFAHIAPQQNLHLETVNGSIEVRLPADAGVELRTSVVNGHVGCDFPLEGQQSRGKKNISGKIGDGRASLTAKSVNGSIRINKI